MQILLAVEVTEGTTAINVANKLASSVADLDMTEEDFDIDTVEVITSPK